MRLKKSEREQVRLKYGGHCAYCGVLLGDRWHADHLEPVVRELLSKRTAAGTWKLVSGKPRNWRTGSFPLRKGGTAMILPALLYLAWNIYTGPRP
ncbi:Phage-associated homing endonuclease [Pseudomonas sp. CMR5c]|nr:Phage-associated homing endonuclease [Pseudomonas sp. CMR5c]